MAQTLHFFISLWLTQVIIFILVEVTLILMFNKTKLFLLNCFLQTLQTCTSACLCIFICSSNLHLKVVSATFSVVCFLSLNKCTCQNRENAFYFTSKALFVLKKIKF